MDLVAERCGGDAPKEQREHHAAHIQIRS